MTSTRRAPSCPFPAWPKVVRWQLRPPGGGGGGHAARCRKSDRIRDPHGEGRSRRRRGHGTPLAPTPTAARERRLGEEIQLRVRAPARRRQRPPAAGSNTPVENSTVIKTIRRAETVTVSSGWSLGEAAVNLLHTGTPTLAGGAITRRHGGVGVDCTEELPIQHNDQQDESTMDRRSRGPRSRRS